ncbi:sestrin-3 isoform X2 [Apteryx mantelli]|uniref:Sestrin-3 isoform X2 n=1 Tax=Apteryx mantelli TaxID=2696672 RepID=A0ABM4F5I6_9AVES
MIVCPQSMEHPRGSRCQRLQGQVVKMSSSEPERPQFLFVKALASRGRLEAVTQQMGYHPQYLDSFLKTQHYLLHMDGPLPFDCRHYIAIMAAARHRCRYLVNLHVLQFLRAGGDPQWLRGLDFIPPKLRNLSEINKILAHRPWLVTKEHIEKLLKISEWSWSLAELVHAVVLLAHCHALASFVFGCGCEQEEGPGGRGTLKPLSPGNQCFCEAASGNGCTQELLRIGRKRSLDSCMELDSLRERIQRIHLEAEGREETRLLQQDREEDLVGEVTGATNLACYMQDPDFGYQDFARRDEDQTQDYSWEDHGFSLVNRLYSDIGHLLDEKFRMVDGLQSSAMAKRQGCEPSVFKRGIWNYIHCMFGIRYDDYDYAEVNHLLERMLKVYIKTVTCYPEKTNPEMFDRFWKQFKHSEKVGQRPAAGVGTVLSRRWQHAAAARPAAASPAGARESPHPGGQDAGGAAVRPAGHHPVHGLVGGGELCRGRAGQHPLPPESRVTRRAGTDGEGLLRLVYLTVLFPFFIIIIIIFFPLLVGRTERPR